MKKTLKTYMIKVTNRETNESEIITVNAFDKNHAIKKAEAIKSKNDSSKIGIFQKIKNLFNHE